MADQVQPKSFAYLLRNRQIYTLNAANWCSHHVTHFFFRTLKLLGTLDYRRVHQIKSKRGIFEHFDEDERNVKSWLLFQIVEGMWSLFNHGHIQFLAHGHDILIPDLSIGLGILFKGEIIDVPLFKQLRQHIRGLASDHVQSRIQLAQALIQVL